MAFVAPVLGCMPKYHNSFIHSFCRFSPGFLPLAFVRTWVGRLQSCLGSCLLLGGNLLPLSWLFSLGGSHSGVVQAPRVFLELFPGVLSSHFQYLPIARGGCG